VDFTNSHIHSKKAAKFKPAAIISARDEDNTSQEWWKFSAKYPFLKCTCDHFKRVILSFKLKPIFNTALAASKNIA